MDSETLTPRLGVVLGAALVVLGVAAYVLSEFASVTALIPAVFGLVVVALGIAGRRGDRTDLAVYGIGALSLLAVAGSARGVPDLLALATGDSVDSAIAPLAQGGTILICLALLGAAVRDVLADR